MALSRDVYMELEDILGPDNISDVPAVLDGYAYQPVMSRGIKFHPRPEVIVLPKSTEDVQAIIKLCNKRGLQSKASATGFGAFNACGGEGVVYLDMRRMNRILEIDEKNMYIVVEPYVSFAQVQAEAMKRGMNCHVITAGSQVSFLASHTSVHGCASQSISQGYSGRNLLGVEWVLPTGEVARLGSLGAGAGWFSGDGPGPSLRGIMRGAGGALGGLGVFTKCACHLHPWPGPGTMEVTGISPEYETEVPPFFENHIIEFPSWEKLADATYKIGEAGIAYSFCKAGGPGSHGALTTVSNNEYWEKWQAGGLRIPRISMALVMAGHSEGEHDYQVKVLDTILAETGGKISPVGEDPTYKKRDYLNTIKICHIPRFCFRQTGTLAIDGIVGMDTLDLTAFGLKLDEGLRDKYAEKGAIYDDGSLSNWATLYEGSHYGHVECGHLFSPKDMETVMNIMQMCKEGGELAMQTPLAPAFYAVLGDVEIAGPACGNFHDWMRKVKKTFDPNTASDPSGYIAAGEA